VRAAADGRPAFPGALPLLGAGLLAGAALASLLKKEKRVYGKGLAQFLPGDASALAKNIACVPEGRGLLPAAAAGSPARRR
jgi:hypothetical protein